MKRLVSVFLSFALCFIAAFAAGRDLFGTKNGYSSWFTDAADGVRKQLVTNVSVVSLVVGESVTVHAAVKTEQEEAVFNDSVLVNWSSDNESVASVSDGVITGVNAGNTTVYASISSGAVKAGITVNVIKRTLTDIAIENAKTEYLIGSTFTPSFTCMATYNDKYSEEVELSSLEINSSAYNSSKEGSYNISVSYTFNSVKITKTYVVSVLKSITYESKYLDYKYSDLKQSSRYSNLQTSYCPSTGTINYLVIPVYFSDSRNWVLTSQKTNVRQRISRAFFGSAGANGWNSVKTFYQTASNGKLTINGTVTDWYEPGKSSSYYAANSDYINALAVEAVDWYFDNNTSVNKADYDSDGNGILDAVALIYARDSAASSNFWAMVTRANMEEANTDDPGLNFYLWASTSDALTDTSNSYADSHTYIHETGHLFGLDDYYDYGGDYWATGGFITMELNTGGQDPFSCLALGWAKAIVPDASCTIELKDFQSSHEVIVLSSSPNTFNSPFDEYLIVELYTPTGLNKFDSTYAWRGGYSTGAQSPGIRIWHIDARLATYNSISKKYSETFGTNPTVKNTTTAFTNSWSGGSDRISVLGSDYVDYSLVFSIRNNRPDLTYKPDVSDSSLKDEVLFTANTVFDPTDAAFSKQFVKNGKFDSGKAIGWTVSIGSITASSSGEYTAVIALNAA